MLQASGTRTIWITDVDSKGSTTVDLRVADFSGTYYSGGAAYPLRIRITDNTTTTGSVSQSRFSLDYGVGSGLISVAARLSETSVSTAVGERGGLKLTAGYKFKETYQVSGQATWVVPFPGQQPDSVSFQGQSVTESVVGQQQKVNVLAGSFTSTLISSWSNTTGTGEIPFFLSPGTSNRTAEYYVPEVGGSVRSVSYDSTGRLQLEWNLVSYAYVGPELQPPILTNPAIQGGGMAAGVAAILIGAAVAVRRRNRRRAGAPPQYYAGPTQFIPPLGNDERFNPPDGAVPPPPLDDDTEER